MTDVAARRKTMVEQQIALRGVRNPKILAAMQEVPRERFVEPRWRPHAFEDRPLPIADGQTISQPYMVAMMIDAMELKGGERVLEIGSGSGYAAAVLARIADEVYGVERSAELAASAKALVRELGITNLHLRHGDDLRSWQDKAPFDAILVSAAASRVPEALKAQLGPEGRMIVPVGSHRTAQELLRVTRKDDDSFEIETLAGVLFVPLIEPSDR